MTIKIISITLSLIFTSLGIIHYYWLLGGKWGLNKVIPTKNEQEDFLPPPRFATFMVAIFLTLFGLAYFFKSGIVAIQVPKWVTSYGFWVIPTIFLLRAIGEFKYVGFFKKIKSTEFAKADSKWFSPLCLMIGILGVIVQLFNK